jgi:hypothetical protein
MNRSAPWRSTAVLRVGLGIASLLTGCVADPESIHPQFVEGFGRLCVAERDCSEGVRCFTFSAGNRRCTVPCKFDAECPAGAKGRKCDGQGYCLP